MEAESCEEIDNRLFISFIQLRIVLKKNNEKCEELERQKMLLESDPQTDIHSQVDYNLLCGEIDRIQLYSSSVKAKLALEDEWSADDYKHPGDVSRRLKDLMVQCQLVTEALVGMKFEVRKELCGEEECSICMQALKQFRVTPCSHRFHTLCLFRWLASNSQRNSCPVCRFNLLPADQD